MEKILLATVDQSTIGLLTYYVLRFD